MRGRGHHEGAPRGVPGLAMTVIQEAVNDLTRAHRHRRGFAHECRRCEAVAFLTGSTPAWRLARETFFLAAGISVPSQGVITRLVDRIEGDE
jgi:hypothetical protein